MRTLLKTIGSISLLLILSVVAQGKEWRGIIPLHSTRADVERLLGPPLDEGNLIALYRTKDEAVRVVYATGAPCEPGKLQSSWTVPRETVVELTVTQVYDPEKGGVPFSDIRIDRSRLKETRDWHAPDTSYFTDEEEGVSYHVGTVVRYVIREGKRETEVQPKVLRGVTYMPAAKDKHLKCPEARPAPNNGMQRTRNKLVSYHQRLMRAADAER